VLLLLVYHDMMNDHCTLRTLDCDVENQIASLTATYVMESEGSVSLRPGLDAYLSRRYLPVSRDIFDKSSSTSVSSVSSVYDEDESPLFGRSQKVKFLDLQNVASSSARFFCSPIQDIINTPIFQMRKLQRQLIQDRDYRDGLEKELSSKLALLAQRESQINQLQHCLDKLKKDQGACEQTAREQIDELENKNNMLQSRFNDVLRQNKELKGNTALMERKVDELAEENGVLSSRMTTVSSQLAIFKAEVDRLTETQTSNEVEWRSTVSNLQSELNEARAQKVREVLQQKISALKLQLEEAEQKKNEQTTRLQVQIESCNQEIEKLKERKREKEDLLLQTEERVKDLMTKLYTANNLLADKAQEVSRLTEKIALLTEMHQQAKDESLAKEEMFSQLLLEKSQDKEVLQNNIQSLKDEVNNLKTSLTHTEEELQREKDLLSKTNKESSERIEGLNHDIVLCKETIETLKEELHVKDEQLIEVKKDNAIQSERLQAEICALKSQINGLCDSLNEEKQQVHIKQSELMKLEEESSHQKGLLQQQLSFSEEMIKNLKAEIETKIEQISLLENQRFEQSVLLKRETNNLQQQVESLTSRLRKAEEDLCLKENDFALKQQEVEGLQTKVSEFEEKIKRLHANIKTKEEELLNLKGKTSIEMERLKEENLKRSEELENEIQLLSSEVQSLHHSLNSVTEQLRLTEDMLARKEMEISHENDVIQKLKASFDDEMFALRQQLRANEEQMVTLKSKTDCQSSIHQQEMQSLKDQLHNMAEALSKAEEMVQTQLQMITEQEIKSAQEKEVLEQKLVDSQAVIRELENEISVKEQQMMELRTQSSEQSNVLYEQNEHLQKQMQLLTSSLKDTEDKMHSKESLLTQQQHENQLKQEELCGLHLKVEQAEKDVALFNQEKSQMQINLQEKEELLVKTKQQYQMVQAELSAIKIRLAENDKDVGKLKDEAVAQMELFHKTKEQVKHKDDLFKELQEQSSRQIDDLQQCMETLKGQLDDCSHKLVVKEELLIKCQLESDQQIDHLKQELVSLNAELSQHKEMNTHVLRQKEETLKSTQKDRDCLIKEKEALHARILAVESLLTQQQHENQLKQEELCGLHLKVEQAEKDVALFNQEKRQMQINLQEKEELLVKTKQQYQMVQAELSAIKIRLAENDKDVGKLKDEAVAQMELFHKTKEQVKHKDDLFKELQEQSSRQIDDLQQCMETLKGQLDDCSHKLVVKEELLIKCQLESDQQIDHLKQERVSLSTELNQHKEMNTHVLRQKEETFKSTQKERDCLIKEKEALHARILAVEKQLEVTVSENQRLAQAKQAIERENDAALKLQTKLQQELQMLKEDKDTLLKEKEKMENTELVKKDLLEQLSAKSTAVEHYKAQMEKAVSHYNSKKQLLQKSEEEVANLKQSLEVEEREVKTVTMENKLLQMEMDKIQSNEKLLLNKIASLEAQLSFADKALRAQNKFHFEQKTSEQMPFTLEVPGERNGIIRTKVRSMSSDSLDQSSLDDSLNNTRKLSAPGEASTPLVRSSERLAAKRNGLQAESLETLYFTPISTRHRATTDFKPEESAKRNSASSVKRRRTTQVINITMTKKTPGRNEADETFYSLTSARSQPNLSSAHKAQGISTELFTTPKATEADQLIGLPGYRRSTIHSQGNLCLSTSTFCVGTENEPEGGPEDWMRIAEIQARNKACLPHLKSSYPLEFDTVRNSALIFTDEELRTGDPIETIRRASVMPGQLQDSLTSHRLSYMGHNGKNATSQSRLSLMPGQAIPKAVSATLRNPKNKRASSTLTTHPTSPEVIFTAVHFTFCSGLPLWGILSFSQKKIRASCFPRPLTPKNKNVTGPAIPHIQTALSPVSSCILFLFFFN
ncbi:hypothetical protein NL108_002731, partial [Boleophthalmus pectinirostris]